jgi:gliding motility-associated protein GldM
MIKYLFAQVDAGSYKFNKLSPAVIAQSSYLLAGDTFRAEVFLAAFDTLSDPIITFATDYKDSVAHTFGADTLGLDMLKVKDGKGLLTVPASAEGVFALKGLIKFKGPDNNYIDYPVSTMYQVAKPSLTVSPTKMNVFYKGVDNPVSISAPGVPADKIRPSISNGSIRKSGPGYIVNVKKGNEAVISVSATLPDGTTASMGKVPFRVKTVPNPAPFFAGKGQGDDKVKKSELTAAQGVAARMENFDFDLKFTVTSFKLTMIVGGTPIEKTSKGNRLSSDMKVMLKKAKPGQKVYIEDIRAKGPDGTVRKLGSLAFKVI